MTYAATPACEEDVVDAVADALRDGARLSITAGSSKASIGRRVEVRPLAIAGLAGVIDYDPAELILTVKPGTPLADVQALTADAGQMLAFEPFDHGPIFGQPSGKATIGGIVAAGVAGSQRISAGAARDHVLGFRAVSGRGEVFAAGGKVVKNVTGFDLPKLAAGSWGRLFAITELTLKVIPRPREIATLAFFGLDRRTAIHLMSRAMGSPMDVAAAANFPAVVRDGKSTTILRIQGFERSVTTRCAILQTTLAEFGRAWRLSADEAETIWRCLRTLTPLPGGKAVWRITIPPSKTDELCAQFCNEGAHYLLDWAGGLIWLATNADPGAVRDAAERAGGHAVLIRATDETSARVPAFHPPPAGIAALEERVRRAFDPSGVFETGRF